jgi:hypothetical protein
VCALNRLVWINCWFIDFYQFTPVSIDSIACLIRLPNRIGWPSERGLGLERIKIRRGFWKRQKKTKNTMNFLKLCVCHKKTKSVNCNRVLPYVGCNWTGLDQFWVNPMFEPMNSQLVRFGSVFSVIQKRIRTKLIGLVRIL